MTNATPLMQSAAARLVSAALALAGLWLAVAWALSEPGVPA